LPDDVYGSPRLYPEATRDLLTFPPEVYAIFVHGYRTAVLQSRAFKHLVTQEACEAGKLKGEVAMLKWGHEQVVAQRAEVRRELEAANRLLGRR
jgi:hypothetical protein